MHSKRAGGDITVEIGIELSDFYQSVISQNGLTGHWTTSICCNKFPLLAHKV